jgi:hypothetical protein
VSVKPAGVAHGVSRDPIGGGGSHPGELESYRLAEEFWKTPPQSIIAAYAKALWPPFDRAPE